MGHTEQWHNSSPNMTKRRQTKMLQQNCARYKLRVLRFCARLCKITNRKNHILDKFSPMLIIVTNQSNYSRNSPTENRETKPPTHEIKDKLLYTTTLPSRTSTSMPASRCCCRWRRRWFASCARCKSRFGCKSAAEDCTGPQRPSGHTGVRLNAF